jgi:hypothetical protein
MSRLLLGGIGLCDELVNPIIGRVGERLHVLGQLDQLVRGQRALAEQVEARASSYAWSSQQVRGQHGGTACTACAGVRLCSARTGISAVRVLPWQRASMRTEP